MEKDKRSSRKEQKEQNIKFQKNFKKDISFFMEKLNWRSFSVLLTGDPNRVRKAEIFVKYFDLLSAINEESKALTFITKENMIPPIDKRSGGLSLEIRKSYNQKKYKEMDENLLYIRALLSWRQISTFLTGSASKLRSVSVPVKHAGPIKKMAEDCKQMLEIIERNKKKYLTE